MNKYYSVKYNNLGSDRIKTAWFNNLMFAKEFAKNDYNSDPVVHNVSRADIISKYDNLVFETGQFIEV